MVILVINLLAIILSVKLSMIRNNLDDKNVKLKFGTLYQGKIVSPQRSRWIFLDPLVFIYRRTIFAVATVYLFEKPAMQMVVH